MAQVTEVQAFKSSDGEVFDTYLKAHHRNVWVLTHRLFNVEAENEDDDYSGARRAATLLHGLLTRNTSNARDTKAYLLALAKEIE